ncbi:MAG: 3-deoxy-7-phosphoheptulonate synthase [Actinobacteria bacterium]|nr:3-deoxy-7-phosphoheptulonate synthase [Actinomycetota bacterium]
MGEIKKRQISEKDKNSTAKDSSDTLVKEGYITVVAGPCAIESRAQLDGIAALVKENGLKYLRGGAYKPRTSPYSFQGLERKGLEYIKEIGQKYDLKTVTEVTDADKASIVAEYVDVLQIGTRNMSNFALLKKVGKIANEMNKSVILKRGWGSTIKEWLLAVEYITSQGNAEVVLCERGIRTFEPYTRFTLDLSAVPVIKKLSKLPIIIDPSHAVGQSDLVIPMSRAAIAVGADGLIVEVHTDPGKALCDGQQALNAHQTREMLAQVEYIAKFFGRKIR